MHVLKILNVKLILEDNQHLNDFIKIKDYGGQAKCVNDGSGSEAYLRGGGNLKKI